MKLQIRLINIGEIFRIPKIIEYSTWNPYEEIIIESDKIDLPFFSGPNSYWDHTWEEYVDFLKKKFEDFPFLTFFSYRSQIKEFAFPIATKEDYVYFNSYELLE